MDLDPKQIQQMIQLLQAMLPKEADSASSQTTAPAKATKKTSKIKTKTRQRKTETNEESENKFMAMPEFGMHKEDASIDKALAKHPPVARMREFDPVTVQCRVCGRSEVVSPGLVFEGASRYKCNNCSTQAG